MQPEPDEARRLLEQELNDPRYQRDATGPLREAADRFFGWLDQLSLNLGPVNLPLGPVLLLVLLLAAVVLCIVLVRPRLQRGADSEELLATPAGVTADELRRRAEFHAQAGRFDEACRELFRSVIRAAEERQELAEQAGRTATEAGASLARAHPAQAREAMRAAELFNYSRYGGRSLQRSDYDALLDLQQRLHSSQGAGSPARAATPSAPEAWTAPERPGVPR
ncbi:DUF4129 domain-containing protein [Nesterenkonia jeotgali]|uniref:Protein-glutamine gamma-glutamyltransferase-like C-terminal domain-containing protein n=1 Tax=Nesterenkonia jeotgali TaxID=317018 RepID=A0A0W8IFQ2_9MICC|nr:DUF4129 domain-containing protein [Nesterenkonia jeotgali]KUG58762.1 hypothetical protein AVL63_01525 [Nesterenkonia jeotgali]